MDFKNNRMHAILFDNASARLSNMKKTVFNAGMGIEEQLLNEGLAYDPWLFSLTYRNGDDWKPNHIQKLLKTVRTHLYRRGIKLLYVWVAELQKRGALHYHIIIWLPQGFKLPKFGRCGWWPHGFTDQKIASKSFGYLMKYISKNDTKHSYPKGVRIYGFGGCDNVVKQRVRFYKSPVSVRTEIEDQGLTYHDVDIRKISGGRVDYLNAKFYPSDWKIYYDPNRKLTWFYKLHDGSDYLDTDVYVGIREDIFEFCRKHIDFK